MGAPVVLPSTIVWPPGVTYMRSSEVALLLGVGRRRVAQWQTDGLITASMITLGGHRRFTTADIEAFLAEARPAGSLTEGDIVSCRDWHNQQPARVLHVASGGPRGVWIRWQDAAAHRAAVGVLVGRTKLVRLLGHGHAGAA